MTSSSVVYKAQEEGETEFGFFDSQPSPPNNIKNNNMTSHASLLTSDTTDTAGTMEMDTLSSGSKKVAWEPNTPTSPTTNKSKLKTTTRISSTISRLFAMEFKGHAKRVLTFIVSPDEKIMISGSDDKTIRIWDLSDGKEIKKIRTGYFVSCLRLTQDGKTIYAGGYDTNDRGYLRTFDAATGVMKSKLVGHNDGVSSISLIRSEKFLLSSSYDSTLKLFDLGLLTVKCSFDGHDAAVTAAAVSVDEKHAVSASRDTTLRIWDLTSPDGTAIRNLHGHEDAVTTVVLTPKFIISGSDDKSVRVWDFKTGLELKKFLIDCTNINHIALSPNHKFIALASDDEVVRMMDLQTGAIIRRFEGHASGVNCVYVTKENHFVFSCSRDKTIRASYVPATENELQPPLDGVLMAACSSKYVIRSEDRDSFQVVEFNPDSDDSSELDLDLSGKLIEGNVLLLRDEKVLIGATNKLSLHEWNLLDGKVIKSYKGAHDDRIMSITITQDEKFVISGGEDRVVRVWDRAKGAEVHKFVGHTSSVTKVLLMKNDLYLVSVSMEEIMVFNFNTRALIQTVSSQDGSMFDAWGFVGTNVDAYDYVITTTGSTLDLVNVLKTGDKNKRYDGRKDSFITAVAVTANEQQIVIGDSGGQIVIWGFVSGKTVELKGHTDEITTLVVTKDNRFLISGSRDLSEQRSQCIIIWNLESALDSSVPVSPLALLPVSDNVERCLITDDSRYILSQQIDSAARRYVNVWPTLVGEKPFFMNEDPKNYPYGSRVGITGKSLLQRVASRSTILAECTEEGDLFVLRAVRDADFDDLAALFKSDYPLPLWSPLPEQYFASFDHEGNLLSAAISTEDRDVVVVVIDFFIDWKERYFSKDQVAINQAIVPTLCKLVENYPLLTAKLLKTPEVYIPVIGQGSTPGLLTSAIKVKNPTIIQALVDQLALQARQEVIDLDTLLTSTSFTFEVQALIKHFPDMAATFLENLSLIKIPQASENSLQHKEKIPYVAIFPENGMIVGRAGDDPLQSPWKNVDSGLLKGSGYWGRFRAFLRSGTYDSLPHWGEESLTSRSIVPIPAGSMSLRQLQQLPKELQLGSGSRKTFLESCEDCGVPEIFGNPSVAAIIEYKWHAFAYFFFFRSFLIYLLDLLFMMIFIVTLGNYKFQNVTNLSGSAQEVVLTAMLVLMAIIFLFHVRHELRQFFHHPKSYFLDPWNILDTIQVGFFVAIVVLYIAGSDSLRYVLAFAAFTKWFGTLYYLQGFDSTGILISMILNIIADAKWMLLVLGIVILGVASSFYALLRTRAGAAGYSDSITSFFSVFNMLLFSNYDFGDFGEEQRASVLAKIVFSFSMILVTIILLNLLIAQMSNSYDSILGRARLELRRLKASLITEIEMTLTDKQLLNPAYFPSCLHVLTIQGLDVFDTQTSVEDRLTYMEQQLEEMQKEVRSQLTEMRAGFDGKMDELIGLLKKQ